MADDRRCGGLGAGFSGPSGLGGLAMLLASLALPDRDAPNPRLAAKVLPFWAASQLSSHPFSSLRFTLSLAVGVACLVALLARFRGA